MGTLVGIRVVLDRTRFALGAGAAACIVGLSALPAEAQRIVMVIEPPSVDTTRFWNSGGDFWLPSLQSLVGHDPVTGDYDASGLAASWEPNEDFTVWTFRLHEDAEFHFDWGPVTAEDVVHSYELHTGDDSTQIGVSLLRAEEVEALDDHTVRFHLPEPRPQFPFANAGRGAMVIYSKAQYDAEGLEGYDTRPAGTGHFEFVSREVGRGVVLRRVEEHWSGEDALHEELDLRFVAEPATRLAMLLSGEAQIVVLPRELHPDALDAGFEIISSTGPAMQTAYLFNGMYLMPDDDVLNPDLPWLDVRIREAVNRAIDREAMLDVLYDGRAERLAQFTMDRRHEGWTQRLEDEFDDHYGYDPDRARELIAEAGYPDAFPDPTIPIVATVLAGNPEFGTMAELIEVFLSEVGLQTEIREMDWAVLGAARRAREAQLLHPMRNAPVRPTEVGIDAFFSSHNRPFNVFEDETTEALVASYKATLDTDERERLAQEIFTHLFETYTSIPIAEVAADVVIDPEHVAGWTFPGVTSIGISHFHLVRPATD